MGPSAAPYEYAVLGGARIAYRVAGHGPVLVLIKNDQRPRDFSAVAQLANRFRVVQVHPVGFGASDRPADYAFGSIDDQVLAVMDREQIERFAVWGFSQTACMAALVARSTQRAVALIAGGAELVGVPTDTTMRRLEREPRLPRASLEFWRAYRQFDWHHELKTMTQPKLVYIGTADGGWIRVHRAQPVLTACGCHYVEFDGLDHDSAGLSADTHGLERTVPSITGWLEQQLPPTW